MTRAGRGGKFSIAASCCDDCGLFLEIDLLSSFASLGSRTPAVEGSTRGLNVENAGCLMAGGGALSESLTTAAPGSLGISIDDCAAAGAGAEVTTGPTDRKPPGLELSVVSRGVVASPACASVLAGAAASRTTTAALTTSRQVVESRSARSRTNTACTPVPPEQSRDSAGSLPAVTDIAPAPRGRDTI